MNEIILKPSWKKWTLIFFFCAAMVAVGIKALDRDKNVGWLCVVVFGLGAAITPLHFFSAQLKLTNEGMLIKNFVREDYLQWDEITDIAIIRVGMNEMVGFNFTPQLRKPLKGRKLSQSISGREGGLPDNYDLKPDELAGLLITYQKASRKAK